MKPEYIVTEIRNLLGIDIGIDVSEYEDCTVVCFYKKDAEVVIAALEKQIPKKPKTDDNRILCPTCNLLIAYNKSIEQHCWTCGQNLEGCVIK